MWWKQKPKRPWHKNMYWSAIFCNISYLLVACNPTSYLSQLTREITDVIQSLSIYCDSILPCQLNSYPIGQNDSNFAYEIFRCISAKKTFCVLIKIVTGFCSLGCNWQCPSIGLDNDLTPYRRQAIIWLNADPIHWRIYAELEGVS